MQNVRFGEIRWMHAKKVLAYVDGTGGKAGRVDPAWGLVLFVGYSDESVGFWGSAANTVATHLRDPLHVGALSGTVGGAEQSSQCSSGYLRLWCFMEILLRVAWSWWSNMIQNMLPKWRRHIGTQTLTTRLLG